MHLKAKGIRVYVFANHVAATDLISYNSKISKVQVANITEKRLTTVCSHVSMTKKSSEKKSDAEPGSGK